MLNYAAVGIIATVSPERDREKPRYTTVTTTNRNMIMRLYEDRKIRLSCPPRQDRVFASLGLLSDPKDKYDFLALSDSQKQVKQNITKPLPQ